MLCDNRQMTGASNLLGRIDAEMIAARKRRDQVTLGALGLLKSEIVKASKEPGLDGSVDDSLVIRVARREVKRREEAAEAFSAGGRDGLAKREQEEARLLRGYLPAGLSAADLEAEVRSVIEELKPEGPAAFGQVMKAASARLAGRAEGGEIAAVARRLLGR